MNPSGIAFLSWKHLSHRPWRSLLLVVAIALTFSLPSALRVFIEESENVLRERARSTPLLIGPRGSSIDLTLNAIYFTPQELPPLPYSAYEQLSQKEFGTTIPLHARFRAMEAPVIGTSLAYFDLRGLEIREGRMVTRLGDCVIGARLAEEKNLSPGDKITSSPENIFDLAGVYPLRMRITGVLAPNQTPDDNAVFVDVKTAWIIEGLAHGHEDLNAPGAGESVRSREKDVIRASASVIEFNEVTEENIASFHFHGDPGTYPLSSAILLPSDAKQRALALSAYQGREATEQMVTPLDAVADLADTLFATQRLALLSFRLLGVAALGLAALVFLLSFRLRESEMRSYAKIGATRITILSLKGTEVAIIVLSAMVLATLAVTLTRGLAGDLLSKLLN